MSEQYMTFYLVDTKTGKAICKTRHKIDLVRILADVSYPHWEIIEA
jgi:hypothetical protein